MTKISELTQWEEDVYQLARTDKVEGGRAGTANVQATQLANRTLWLKAMLESVKDSREHTFYRSATDPDGTKTGLAGTTDGEVFRVAQGLESDSSFKYYLNDGGSAKEVADFPGMFAVKNLVPLNATTRYSSSSEGGEFAFGEKYDTVTLDREGNVLWFTRGNQYVSLIDSEFPQLSAQSLTVDGQKVDPRGTLPGDDRDNLVALSAASKYLSLSNEGEFAFGAKFDTLTMDDQGNVLWFTRGGKYVSYLDSEFPLIKASRLVINGQELDAAGTLPGAERDNLLTLSEMARFSSSAGEYEFNPKKWVLVDADGNILFDVDSYLTQSKLWDEAYRKSSVVEPQKTNPLAPFTVTDTAGKSQVRVFNMAASKEMQVTDGNSNETSPRAELLDRVVWQSDRTDSAPGGLFYAALPDLKEHAYIARPKLVGWGHSYMENSQFLNKLAELTGLYGYNFGKSSTTSTSIASKQGGSRHYYLPEGDTIPASGSVNLLPAVSGALRTFANGAMGAIACTFGGVEGLFGWDGTAATFTRSAEGDAVALTEQQPVKVHPITTQPVTGGAPKGTRYDLHDECINIFWLGRNNISQLDTIISNAIGMVEYLKNIGKRVVILPDFPGSGENTGTSASMQVANLNAALKARFPEYYCEIDGVDLLQNFINHHNPDFAGDVEDVTSGVTPRSLRYDWLHPSQGLSGNGKSLSPENALYVGADVNAQFVYEFIKRKGWL